MLIADELSYREVFEALEAASERLGREVHPQILSKKELARRVKTDSAFVTRVLSGPKIWLIGGKDALGVGESMRAE